ncbi:20S-pre-rRNA D-site endonuclease nob1 [Coemansia asiatica]|uniref:20S-pre-rRNA D-site endonuclease NOB1 n=1 Tax=Coemansia asiatica TaxID=1052880 RepID=A0A9W8CL12_9FUNG|nr:20S-pre-rRNA D-site endonuclease nob1 [Coemansia asiatica]
MSTVPAENMSVQALTHKTSEEQKDQDQQLQNSQQTDVSAAADSSAKKKKKKKSKGISIDQNDGKPVVTLVVDTNPFVKGLPLEHIATKFVTVPDVVSELKSRASKERYEMLNLKHGIETMVPDTESMQIVCDFAKKTGDFASLSLADLRVVALAFMLEKQANGMRHLRTEPVGDQPNIADRDLLQTAQIVGGGGGGSGSDQTRQDEQQSKGEDTHEDTQPIASNAETHMAGLSVETETEHNIDNNSKSSEQSEETFVKAENEAVQANNLSEPSVLQSIGNDEFDVGSAEEFDEGDFDDNFGTSDVQNSQNEDDEDNDDDGWQVAGPKHKKKVQHTDDFFNGEWITPRNVKQHMASTAMGMKQTSANESKLAMKVACVTSDFAMQNVMLKMGIRLVTPDGISVTRLYTWVLRCHACGRLTGNMNKQFCPSCGHATLKRCSVSTGANGRLQVHLKTNYVYNLRGTIYSMPKPRGGHHTTKDVITRADDKAYLRAINYKEHMEAKSNAGLGGVNSLFDPDFIPGLMTGNLLADNNGYGVATDARGMPMVTRNRKNPNAIKRTGNRKNKKRYD